MNCGVATIRSELHVGSARMHVLQSLSAAWSKEGVSLTGQLWLILQDLTTAQLCTSFSLLLLSTYSAIFLPAEPDNLSPANKQQSKSRRSSSWMGRKLTEVTSATTVDWDISAHQVGDPVASLLKI